MERNRLIPVLAIALAAICFGFLGLFVRSLNQDYGLSSMDSVFIRIFVSTLILLIILGLFARRDLRIKLKDVPLLVLFGLFKMLSDFTFFYSQQNITLCLSTLLQMTAPYYVMVISLFLFREKITIKKLTAMSVGTMGCVLVTGIITETIDIDVIGVVSALMSGLFFGMTLIGSKLTFDRGIKPSVSLFYTFLFALLFTLPLTDFGKVGNSFSDTAGLLTGLGLGLVMTLIPFYIYVWGTSRIEPTIVSAVSVIEVAAAAFVGMAFYQEDLSLLQILGVGFVILSVFLINIRIHLGFVRRFGKYVPYHYRKKTGSDEKSIGERPDP